MVYDIISAKEALAMAQEARKHYREEERISLLKSVDADIKDACKVGELSVTVEVEEEDLNFLISSLNEKGYVVDYASDDNRRILDPISVEICWD